MQFDLLVLHGLRDHEKILVFFSSVWVLLDFDFRLDLLTPARTSV
jgi:hypothetical protein